jgi:hypothetical protein
MVLTETEAASITGTPVIDAILPVSSWSEDVKRLDTERHAQAPWCAHNNDTAHAA